jgi:hypothetical protein
MIPQRTNSDDLTPEYVEHYMRSLCTGPQGVYYVEAPMYGMAVQRLAHDASFDLLQTRPAPAHFYEVAREILQGTYRAPETN